MSHIRAVRADPEPARGWWHGVRVPGTQVPGIITAGTFYQSDGAVFYDVHDPERTIVIDLDHEHYKRLVIEVESPDAAGAVLPSAIPPRPPGKGLDPANEPPPRAPLWPSSVSSSRSG